MNVDQIIARIFAGKASQEELDALQAWKAEAQDNIAAIKEMQSIDTVVSELADYHDYDVDSAWESMSQIVQNPSEGSDSIATQKEAKTAEPKVVKMPWLRYVAAACVLMLVAVVGWQIGASEPDSGTQSYVATDGMLNATLDDGSMITLDEGSELTAVGERAVSLEGRGYFEVAKSATEQFTVQLPQGKVTVLGTKFTIDAKQGSTRLYVSEGSVRFDHESRKVVLTAGDLLTLENGEIIKVKSDGQAEEFWRVHKLTFRNRMLQSVVSTLNQLYDKKIVIDNLKTVADCKVNTTFDSESIEEILAELKQTLGLKFHLVGETIHIVDANC